VDWQQPFDGLNLDDQPAVDQQVHLECPLDTDALEIDIDRLLTRNRISQLRQPRREHGLVHAFKQARPQIAMQSQGDVQNVTADGIDVTQALFFLRVLCASARKTDFRGFA